MLYYAKKMQIFTSKSDMYFAVFANKLLKLEQSGYE